MVLPIVCMGLGMTGEYCVTMRSTMMDVLSEDYITTARAKGLQGKLCAPAARHAKRHAAYGDACVHEPRLCDRGGGAA